MTSKILKISSEKLLIEWEEGEYFGQLSMTWDHDQQRFILDSENMGVQHVIKVFRNLENPDENGNP